MPSSSSSAVSAPPSGGKRLVRVRGTGREPAVSPPSNALPTDSMAYCLLLAARALTAVRAGRSLADVLPELGAEPHEARAAAQDIIYGALRAGGRDEFLLGQLMAHPLSHAETQALLLAALYRLETRPDDAHMVVDQAVAAAATLAGGALKGVVNGVLRNYLRRREALRAALAQNDAALHQHPAWWLNRLRRAYPADWARIAAAGNGAPPMGLRVNTRHLSRESYLERLHAAGLGAQPVGTVGALLDNPVGVDRLPGFADGWVSVQDAGAQRAAELLDPAPGARVLDACAAPGGKTAHLLERADLDLLALEIDPLRTRRIADNLQRLGLRATVRSADCADTAAWWDGRPFDAILADVPCSGSGVARRHPDMKLLRRESDVRRLAHTQAAILDALWPLLKPGGRLLYATCSVFTEENSGQTDAFLARHGDASRLVEERWLPDETHDGFYYALLRRN